MDINESILFWNYPKEIRNMVKGVSYHVREVQHTFSKGKFTQELTCNINTFNNYRGSVESNANRDIASDPNTNVGNERQTSDITKSGYTGLVGDAPVGTVNPEPGNQGGTNVNASSPNAASQSNDDGILNNNRPPADQGGRNTDPTTLDVNTRLRIGFGLQTGQESQSLVNQARAALRIPVGGTSPGGGQ
jgi:hypothetical protein